MADVAITVANTGVYSGVKSRVVLVGAAVTHGQVGYLNSTNRDYRLAQCDGTAEEAEASVVFMSQAASGEYALVVDTGDIDIGGSLSLIPYVVSATPGAICPQSDLVSTNYITYVGFGKAADKLGLDFNATGLQTP